MPRPQTIALSLPNPLPPLPQNPPPAPTPLQTLISQTLSNTDYDAVCAPLANPLWQERWDRLCLRPMEDEEAEQPTEQSLAERESVDREADLWRREPRLNREELNVTRLEETQSMVATASEWLELDSPDEGIRFDSELALRAELQQALYLAVPVLILPAPILANRAFLPSYARAIADLLTIGGPTAFTQLSIRIPISDPAELIHQGPGPGPAHPNGHGQSPIPAEQTTPTPATDKRHKRMSSMSTRPTSMHQGHNTLPVIPDRMRVPSGASGASGVSATSSIMSARSAVPMFATGDPSSTWEMWDCIRRICGYHPRLSVTLDLTNPLPPSVGALSRWTAEPIKNIWLPANAFIPNAKGYPVLSKACQAFLRGMAKQYPTIILHNTQPSKHPSGGPTAYLQYIRHVSSTPGPVTAQSATASAQARIPENGAADFTAGYADYLQAPLQPLMDDLGSATYDVFERDPVKYRQYEEAIYLALMDLPEGVEHVITVVGAGRGPLVARSLAALEKSGRKAKVYALDKNVSAFTTLQERKAIEWHDRVEIIFGDMRNITVPALADIMVSELLGSFGDNELSPECLDGAMRFLKPEGISIPISYTAHLTPISSTKLYTEATAAARAPNGPETPYVVMMSAVNIISGDGGGVAGRCGERIQQCWQFEHPRRDLILDHTGVPLTNSHNTRSSTLTFHIPHAAPLHGLAGYFEAHLYANIGLSIHPETAHRVSPDMFSWFPIFFPFKEPLYLPSGAELDVGIWRLWDSGKRRVWYEWCAEAYLPVGAPIAAGIGQGVQGGLGGYGGQGGQGGQGGVGLSPTSASAIAGRSTSMSASGALNSPMMDAPFSPGVAMFGAGPAGPVGMNGSGEGGMCGGRIKIGQTSLHNPGGVHSWVGL